MKDRTYHFDLPFLLKASRPGLWFATVWLYILPTSQQYDIFQSSVFWLGLFYVCFPLNLMVYGWNDMVDRQADRVNPRKGNFLFGALGTDKQLNNLPPAIIVSQALFYIPLIAIAGIKMLVILLLQLLILYLYNHPTKGWRSRPPLELICQFGYLLVLPLSIWINDSHPLSVWAYLYLACFAIQSHFMGEVMDIEPDRLAGKKTTATLIGTVRTKILIMVLVSIEIAIVFFVFKDAIFTAMLALGLVWLLLDLLVLFKSESYTLFQMKLFGYGSNVIAYVSMAYVWWSACLFL